jgi:acyl-coenzyme A thioesterase PaaI-like protein
LGGEYQGGPGFIHGGIIAVVLDEAMGKVCRFSDVRAVTAEMSIEYKKPIRVDEEFIVEAFQESRDGRVFFIVGEIRRVSGQLLARGTGRFVAVDPLTFTV